MAQHIQLRRGTAADLPTGGTIKGEPRFTTDTGQLYVDSGTANVLIGGTTDQTGWVTMAGTAATDNSAVKADSITMSDANLRLVAKAGEGYHRCSTRKGHIKCVRPSSLSCYFPL